MPQKMVIIDGSSLMHRAFYALPPLTTAAGLYTNAVYGFTTMLVKLLSDNKPDLIAVAFDKGRETFRSQVYAEYKSHRQATPGELSEQFALVHEVLAAFGIPVLEKPGYEADDIIGTLAAQASRQDYDVFIVTGDRDALQLIGPRTKVMLTRKGISETELVDINVLQEKYGLLPEQITDLKGLMGDASDNIPGVPGIGEKTAGKLLREFGSVENLLANIDKVSGKKLQESLRANAELALLSKKLATIVCDVPLDCSLEALKAAPDVDRVREVFQRLEFKSLLAKLPELFDSKALPQNETTLELSPAKAVTSFTELREIVARVKRLGSMVFFPLTSGKIPAVTLIGLAIWAGDEAVYIPHNVNGWELVWDLLADETIPKVTYNAKDVCNACKAKGTELRGLCFDIQLAAYLLEPTAAKYPLTELACQHLGLAVGDMDKEHLGTPDYAGWAAEVVQRLYPVLKEKLVAAGLAELYEEIELPLVPVLSEMEIAGIRVDLTQLDALAQEITDRIETLLTEIYQLAGQEFNVNSTRQLGHILFEVLKLPVIKKTKTGYSTDAEVLEKLAGQHPLIDCLLEYRLLTKLKSTYLDGLRDLIRADTGRIHTHFNQTVTATGRLSSSEPNLQNIPIRTEIGRRIRELFVPGPGYDWIMSADYSQIELRVLAHMSGDDNLIDAFRHNQDIHTHTAAEVFGVPMAEVTAQMRARAKAVNFGIVYGISDFGLSRDIGVSRKEAGQYIDSYFAKYRGVKNYIDNVINLARQQGYVTTLFGRRRFLPDINSGNFNQRAFAERTAMNTPIQGTAADIIKKAMITVYRQLRDRRLKSRLLLQVHDELVLEVAEAERVLVAQLVKQAMEDAVTLAVPLVADVKTGANWAQAK
ncbi:DNA polymerase I [Thermosinus carboxydivorans Nor1]|uniref:DNA polymerase I n=1 Tax=Thermosinus carboxydivorans Nor1 TaxID=401526 RepID=A1HPM3_9FIRM|nr:DNA polymerase I [Thermosinus carboxydivorans]EAX47993.1 DNA polymerase I [Thermosinus carboxydivorans Nor1]